jgi:hypothetical protein
MTQPTYPQPPYTQPPYTQPPYTQPPYTQPPYTQPPYTQPAYGPPPAGNARLFAVAAVGLTVVVGAGAAVGVVVSRPDATPASGNGTGAATTATVQITKADLDTLVDARSSALTRDSRDDFLKPLAPGDASLRTGQGHLFDNLQKLPFTVARYATLEQKGRSADRFGRAVTIDLDVAFVHQIEGYDAAPVAEWYRWTVTKKDAAAPLVITRIAGAPGSASSSSKTVFYPGPWDRWPDMQVVTTPHTMFLVDRPLRRQAEKWAPVAERAATDVLAAWRSGGQTGPVFDGFVTSLVAGRGQLGSLYQIATDKVTEAGHAMAMPQFGAQNRSGAERIVIDTTSTFLQDGPDGAGEIFRHEYAHAMIEGLNGYDSRSWGLSGPEPWVVEGFAEFVANRASKDPGIRTAASHRRVRGGQFTGRLPAGVGWSGADSATTSFNYFLGHQAYRYTAGKYGVRKAFALAATYYRGGTVDAACRSALGVDLTTFERGWAAFVRADAR